MPGSARSPASSPRSRSRAKRWREPGSVTGLVEEAVAVDRDAGEVPRGDEAAIVADRDLEDQTSALDGVEHRLGGDAGTLRHGREVGELHGRSDGCVAVRKSAGDG